MKTTENNWKQLQIKKTVDFHAMQMTRTIVEFVMGRFWELAFCLFGMLLHELNKDKHLAEQRPSSVNNQVFCLFRRLDFSVGNAFSFMAFCRSGCTVCVRAVVCCFFVVVCYSCVVHFFAVSFSLLWLKHVLNECFTSGISLLPRICMHHKILSSCECAPNVSKNIH